MISLDSFKRLGEFLVCFLEVLYKALIFTLSEKSFLKDARDYWLMVPSRGCEGIFFRLWSINISAIK